MAFNAGRIPLAKSLLSMMLPSLLALAGGCTGANIVASTKYAPQETGFVQRHVVIDGFIRPVWVFVPTHYNPNQLYPAILFLHGLFEEGNGDTNVLSAGLGPVIARNPDKWPFITIFPQSTGTWRGDDRQRLALAALHEAQKQYAIDPDRVILAGLSYGGLGVWEIGAKNRERFAALVPVSGPGETELADKLAPMSIWAFASQDDPFVPATNSVQMCDAIKSHGGHAILTEFQGDAHDCWAQAIDKSDLVNWMLHQRRDSIFTAIDGSSKSSFQASGRLRAWNDQ